MEAERVRMLADYRRFWAVVTTAARLPPASWPNAVAAVSVEPLRSELLDGLAAEHTSGIVDYGTIALHPQIIQIYPDRVSIVDCQDASNSGTMEVDTGVAKSVGSARTLFTAVLTLGRDRRWRLSQGRLLADSC